MTPQELKNSILQLAIQGKLVEQRPEEGTAEELYRQIQREKQALIKAGKIKKEKPLPEITEDEIPFDIPESWKWNRLNSIVYNRGQVTPTERFSYIDIGSIDNQNQRLNTQENIIDPDKAPSRARKIVEFGDILYSTVRPYLHNMCIVDRDFSCQPIASTGFAAMVCYDGILNKYLFYFLLSPTFDQYANDTENAKGVAYPAINDDRLYRAIVPLPPLAEQKRIVARIEELLPLIDRYEKAWNRLENFNRRFPADMQKSLLQLAIQGKLVEQRPKEGTGEELYQQIQKEKQALNKAGKIKKEKPLPEITDDEIPFDIPESWKWIRLQDIILSISAGKSLRCNEVIPEDQEPGIIKVSAVTWGTFREEESKTCISLSDWNEEYRICEGDFLISRANTKKLVGACVIVESIRKMLMLSDKILRISFASDVDSQYLLYAMRSDVARAQIESSATGTSDSMKNISQNNIREIILPLPPLAEQKRIVAKLEELLPLCDRLK